MVGLVTTGIDMTLVREILTDAMKVVEELDGADIEDTALGNKPADAKINRALLNLADQLGLAESLIRNEYWTGKGLISYDIT